MAILKSSDSTKTAIEKMAKQGFGGDIDKGAKFALKLLVKSADRFDPEKDGSEFRHLLLLDKFGIYGPSIYTLYDCQCNGDVSLLILLLRVTESGEYSSTGLKKLASRAVAKSSITEGVWRDYIKTIRETRPRMKCSYDRPGSKNYWAFLFFRTLWLNEDYKEYCVAIRKNDVKKRRSLERKYPRLLRIYFYWEDIFGEPEHRSDFVAFDSWTQKNVYKLENVFFDNIELVSGGDTIVANERTAYFTLPQSANKGFLANVLNEQLAKTFKALPNKSLLDWLDIGVANREVYKSLYRAEQRLDVYYWQKVHKMPHRQIALKLYCSDSDAWMRFGISIDRQRYDYAARKKVYYENMELKSQLDVLKDLLSEGKAQVNNVLLTEFPDAT